MDDILKTLIFAALVSTVVAMFFAAVMVATQVML